MLASIGKHVMLICGFSCIFTCFGNLIYSFMGVQVTCKNENRICLNYKDVHTENSEIT